MAEIIFRFPSHIQYGYVELRATPEELGYEHLASDGEMLGNVYVRMMREFRNGETAAKEALEGRSTRPVPESPGTVATKPTPVQQAAAQIHSRLSQEMERPESLGMGHSGVSAKPEVSKDGPRAVNMIMSDEDVDTMAEAEAILKAELGATVVDRELPPWSPEIAEAAGQAAVAKPKPWENGGPKPPSVDHGFDFN